MMIFSLFIKLFPHPLIYKLSAIQLNNASFLQYFTMKDHHKTSRKRTSMLIDLLQTNAGYSVIQGSEILNRTQNQPSITPPPVAIPAPSLPPKDQKMVVKQNTMLLLKAPMQAMSAPLGKTPDTPTCSRQFSKWFSLQKIHPIQQEQIRLWVLEEFPRMDVENLEASDELKEIKKKYLKDRKIIVQVYKQKYSDLKKYMPCSAIRKYIYDDAYWLMKIHTFLTSQGIINSTEINFNNEEFKATEVYKKNGQGIYQPLKLNSQPSFSLKQFPDKGYLHEKNQILLKITHSIRPHCDFCGIHCGIIWFQHLRFMDPKQINTIMKNVNSKNPPLSQKEYEIILCINCYCSGNFPLLLTHHDFRKMSINSKLQPDRKKKMSKHKRKEEKRKRKKQIAEENQEYRQQEEENQPEPKDKQNGELKSIEEEEEVIPVVKPGRKRQRIYTNQAMRLAQTSMLPPNPVINDYNEAQNEQLNSKDSLEKTKEMINLIISQMQEERHLSLQEIHKIVSLVNAHGDNWQEIHKHFVENGNCSDISPYQLLKNFIFAPNTHNFSLSEQYKEEEFINCNRKTYKSQFLTKFTQKVIDNCADLTKEVSPIDCTNFSLEQKNLQQYKDLLDKLVKLHIRKIQKQIELTQKLEKVSLQKNRIYEQVKRDFQQ